MDFDEIENLEEEQLNDMYNEVVEFGDEAHLAGCCCASGVLNNQSAHASRAGCVSWCRRQRSTCSNWSIYHNCRLFGC